MASNAFRILLSELGIKLDRETGEALALEIGDKHDNFHILKD